MKKPENIEADIWLQHVNWMRVMREGQLTSDPYSRQVKFDGKGVPARRPVSNP